MRKLMLGLGAAALTAIVISLVAATPSEAGTATTAAGLPAIETRAGSDLTPVHCRRYRHCHRWRGRWGWRRYCHRCG